jgi:hypothetical protein
MKKTRQRYDRAFKISVVAELESGKPLAQIACEQASIQACPLGGEKSWPRIPKKHLAVMQTSTRTRQGLQNLRSCSAKLMPRSSF